MPKSRRHTTIALTAVSKKNKSETKQVHYARIHEALDDCSHAFVLVPHHMRSQHMKDLRERFPGSKFFVGKNTIMIRALGTDEASEYKTNLHKLSPHLYGGCILFVTTQDKQEVIDFFKTHKTVEYARGGFVPIETLERHPGPLELPHSLEPYLRQLGMPTRLRNGIVHLEGEYQLCQAGRPITHEQARLLKILDIKLAEFRIEPVAIWSNDGTVEILDDPLEPKPKRQIKTSTQKKDRKNNAADKNAGSSDESGDDIMEDDEDDEDGEDGDGDDGEGVDGGGDDDNGGGGAADEEDFDGNGDNNEDENSDGNDDDDDDGDGNGEDKSEEAHNDSEDNEADD